VTCIVTHFCCCSADTFIVRILRRIDSAITSSGDASKGTFIVILLLSRVDATIHKQTSMFLFTAIQPHFIHYFIILERQTEMARKFCQSSYISKFTYIYNHSNSHVIDISWLACCHRARTNTASLRGPMVNEQRKGVGYSL